MTKQQENGAMPNGRGFGKWLAQQLLDHGYSQAKLADKTGLTQTCISQIKRGIKLPDDNQKAIISKILGVAQPEVVEVHGPITLPGGPILTAAEVISAIETIIGCMDAIGDSESIDAARERLIEAQMWIERHGQTS
jgi:transcriptional regulator with XRE-family HTH domain